MADPRSSAGSCDLPLLLIFYINSLPDEIKNLVNDSLFADDLTIWSSHYNKEEASRYVQLAVQKIDEWCKKKKKMLLSEKSVVTFFSSSSGDARWKPDITLGGNTLKFDPCPKLLGLVINRTLSFQQHVDKVVDKVRKRCNLLACLRTSNWGWKKKPLGRVFLATSGASWTLPPLPRNHDSPKPRWTDSTAPRTRPSVGLLGKPPPLQLRPCVWRAACRATGPTLRDSQPSTGREPTGAPRATPLVSPWRRTNLTGSAETAGENSATGSVPPSPTSSPTGSPFPPLRKRFGPHRDVGGSTTPS